MDIRDYNNSRSCNDKRSLCHAPSYSMHFSQNGLVSACSYTRFMPLGKYPDQSIDEIWFGNVAYEIRTSMRTSNFPKGCNVCASDAESGNFEQMRSKLYEQYARTPKSKFLSKLNNKFKYGHYVEFPKVISFELSNTCNLECIMCLGLLSSSIRKNREKLPPLAQKYGKEFLHQIEFYIPHLQEAKFFGGEPFLIDLYLDIWELFVKKNPLCKIYITTNGTILNNRVKRILESLPNFQIVISLDAITKSTYEKIRVNANFDQVMSNLNYFKDISERNGRHLIISPTYMSTNWHEYPLLLKFADENNILFESNVLVTPYELSLSNFSPEQLAEVIEVWGKPRAFVPEDTDLANQNLYEFNKALDNVKFMFDEQTSFYNHPWGKKLSNFKCENKMEVCILMQLKHNMRSFRDPSLPLRFKELWAESGELLIKLVEALYKIASYLDNSVDFSLKNQLTYSISLNYSQELQSTVSRNILLKETYVVDVLNYIINKDINSCLILFKKCSSIQIDISMDDVDFF